MQTILSPANTTASPAPTTFAHEVIRALARTMALPSPIEIVHAGHSSDVATVRFEDGRRLVVRRSQQEFQRAMPRLMLAKAAASQLSKAGVLAPAFLPLPHSLEHKGVSAYWRLPEPTLAEVWPSLSSPGRTEALRSLGQLARRIHTGRLSAQPWIPVGTDPLLSRLLLNDVRQRLLPAVAAAWPDGIGPVTRLAALLPTMAWRLDALPVRLLHGDLHMGNVLCRVRGDKVRCVGVIDLEDVAAGPAELDLAILRVNHGPEFGQPLRPQELSSVEAGYGGGLDPVVCRLFRAYQLANMGYNAAAGGLTDHAHSVATACAREWDLGVEAYPHRIARRINKSAAAPLHNQQRGVLTL